VRKEERARWNAAESINRFGWSGSAVLGGHLVDRYGYRLTFLITAGLQLSSALILSSLAGVVEREAPAPSYARVAT
jgi:MFS family permease